LTSLRCPKVLEEKESQKTQKWRFWNDKKNIPRYSFNRQLCQISTSLRYTSLGCFEVLTQNCNTNTKKRRKTRCLSHYTFYFLMKQWYATLRWLRSLRWQLLLHKTYVNNKCFIILEVNFRMNIQSAKPLSEVYFSHA